MMPRVCKEFSTVFVVNIEIEHVRRKPSEHGTLVFRQQSKLDGLIQIRSPLSFQGFVAIDFTAEFPGFSSIFKYDLHSRPNLWRVTLFQNDFVAIIEPGQRKKFSGQLAEKLIHIRNFFF